MILCADNPLSCEHQGLVISDDFVQQVLTEKVVRGTGLISGLYEESRNVVAVPITDGSKTIGIVISSVPVSAEMIAFDQLSRMYVIITLLVVLLAVSVAWYLIRRHSKPLNDVAQAANDFGHGKLDARVQVDSSTSQA